jgi:hypothetical protein
MRKIFVMMLLLGSAFAAFAQGTVFFSNGGFEKISSGIMFADGHHGDLTVVPATAGLLNFGLFYGFGATQPATLTFRERVSGVNSTSVAGVIASPYDGVSPITSLDIPGSRPGETDVWIQIAGWSASYGTDWVAAQEAAHIWGSGTYFGETGVLNVAPAAGGLGPSIGPGAIIWQTATGTDPTKFAGGFGVYSYVPEPSTVALLGLGVVAVLIFRRRK